MVPDGIQQGKGIMARRSIYYFDNYEDYDAAGTHISQKMPGNYNNGVYFESMGGDTYKAEIWDNCDDPILAASIIREHGGSFYSA
jgi:hypothetical protein